MIPQEINRIENAIRHIQTATDVDPWACEIAVNAMEKQIPEPAEIKPAFVRDDGIVAYKRVCPDCGYELNEEDICPNCGKWIRWHE